jgi:hypothetical protein
MKEAQRGMSAFVTRREIKIFHKKIQAGGGDQEKS